MTKDYKGHILFVDEDRDTCELMEIILGRAGYRIISVCSIAEGKQQAQTRDFDLILLDWFLEDGTGIDLCKWIRSNDERTPIFFYTGMTYPQELQQAIEAGAQGYFIKPVEVDNLLRTIEQQIEARSPRSSHIL
jgi:two-component system, OmpR family, manganese sensing response regulator